MNDRPGDGQSRDPACAWRKDPRNEKTGKKIAEGRNQKIPYLLILGDKEAENGTISVRSRAGDEGTMELDAFLERINEEIRTKKND